MPIEVNWYIPNRVILAKGWGAVTKEENAESDRQVRALIDAGTPPVHVLMDVSQVEDFPFFNANYQSDNARQFLKHQNLGWGVVCGTTNPVVRLLSGVVLHVVAVKLKMFPTFEEGVDFLLAQDPSLK